MFIPFIRLPKKNNSSRWEADLLQRRDRNVPYKKPPSQEREGDFSSVDFRDVYTKKDALSLESFFPFFVNIIELIDL